MIHIATATLLLLGAGTLPMRDASSAPKPLVPPAAAVAQPAETQPEYDLASYLRIATTYGFLDRGSAVRQIGEWPPAVIRAAVADLKGRRHQLRAFSRSPQQIAIGTVEAAVLMHAEAGLRALRTSAMADAECHLGASVALFGWSREAASEVRTRAANERGNAEPIDHAERAGSEYDVWPRIDRPSFSLLLAAGALAAGSPTTALPFAADARRSAPFDPDVQLVFGGVAEGLGEEERLRGRESGAARWRAEAVMAFSEAVVLDAGLFPDPRIMVRPTARGLEARLHLGRLELEQGKLAQARQLLERVDASSSHDRQLYLARLLLGRVAERQGRIAEAVVSYERALEVWAEGQAAAFALAHALERSSGPRAALPMVAKGLIAPLRRERPADPWRSYLFGHPGLAEAVLDRVRTEAIQ